MWREWRQEGRVRGEGKEGCEKGGRREGGGGGRTEDGKEGCGEGGRRSVGRGKDEKEKEEGEGEWVEEGRERQGWGGEREKRGTY